MHERRTSLLWAASVVAVALAFAPCTTAQTIPPPFDADYSFADLGSAPGVPANYGGVTFRVGDPNTLLIGGAAAGTSGVIRSIALVRDGSNRITGFSGTASAFASGPSSARAP